MRTALVVASILAVVACGDSARASLVGPPDAIVEEVSTVDTTYSFDQIGMFGAAPAINLVSQTFTVPSDAPKLMRFSFWLNGKPEVSSAIKFHAMVVKWDGNKTTGSVVWQSDINSGPTHDMQRYYFNVPNVALEAGQQYAAILTTIGDNSPEDALVLVGYTCASSPEHFWAIYDARSFDAIYSEWNTDTGCSGQAAFTADFSN